MDFSRLILNTTGSSKTTSSARPCENGSWITRITETQKLNSRPSMSDGRQQIESTDKSQNQQITYATTDAKKTEILKLWRLKWVE